MAYDHGEKAGNEGDVVKHVALVALLDTILASGSRAWASEFRFSDLYAGNATSNLRDGGDWKHGIGRVRAGPPAQNAHVRAWLESYVAEEPCPGDSYPGSALIARDAILRHEQKPRLATWDIHPAPLGNLWTLFGSGDDSAGAQPRKGTSPSRVHCEKPFNTHADLLARARHPDVQGADFVLLDPPDANPGAAHCLDIVEEFLKTAPAKAFLVWLPITVATKGKGHPPDWSQANASAHIRAVNTMNLSTTLVLWAPGGRALGCQLVYPFQRNSPERIALEKAVEDVVRVLGWNVTKTLSLPGGASVSVPGGACPCVLHAP